jgi:hypothetical protein
MIDDTGTAGTQRPNTASRRREPTHADIMDRLDRGDKRFDDIEAILKDLKASQAEQAKTMLKLSEVQDAWVAVKGTGNFIIWWGKIMAAGAVIVASLLSIVKYQLWRVLGGQ